MRHYLFLALALCLLSGCGVGADAPIGPSPVPPSPSVTPTPELTEFSTPIPSPEPTLPEEALALLELSDTDYVMDRAAGDLNGDGVEDWAVVVERLSRVEEPGEYFTDAPRTLAILLGDGKGGFYLGQTNDHFIRRDTQGGVFGDPYEGIRIEGGGLQYSAYGGSSWRWRETYHFSWREDGLALKAVDDIFYSCVTEGLGGEQALYDFSAGEYTLRAWCGGGGDMDGKLLWQEPLLVSAPRLEELPNVEDESGPWVETPPLPNLGRYEYETMSLYAPAQYSPEAMLDKARKEYHPDMWRVDIPWTEETRANYSAAVGYEVPGYYYTDGQAILHYYELEVRGEDLRPYLHSVWYRDEDWENVEIYRYLDETGEGWGTNP